MTRLLAAIAAAVIAITAPALPGAGSSDAHSSTAQAPDPRPNIVVISTDDMRVDDLAAMPKTRRILGAEGSGVRFRDAFVSTPLCCPSRAQFLTGQYASSNGVWQNTPPNGGSLAFHEMTTPDERLPSMMQAAGYETAMLGKYLNGYGGPDDGVPGDDVPSGWTNWRALHGGRVANYTDFDVNAGGTIREVRDGYQTRYFTRHAVRQISTWGDAPEFLWLSYYAPHGGNGDGPDDFVVAEPQYRGDSQVGPPTSPAFNEAVIADKPPWIRDNALLVGADRAQVIDHRRERRDGLRSVDDGVAAVRDALTSIGELRDTMVVFTSDNGFLQGEHRARLKSFPYDESVRVPLLVRYIDGLGGGFTSEQPVQNIDLVPTFLDLAGVPIPATVDGRSLLAPPALGRTLRFEFLRDDGSNRLPVWCGVWRTNRMYVEYVEGERELYNLDLDPWQQQNAAGTGRPVQPVLAAALDNFRAEGGCPTVP